MTQSKLFGILILTAVATSAGNVYAGCGWDESREEAVRTVSRPTTQLGSACGLIDSADDLNGYEIESKDLGKLSSKELGQVRRPTSSQIIATARNYSIGSGESVKLDTVEQAVKYLIETGYEANLSTLRLNGRLYRVVKHYPGDNPVGLVFRMGSSRPVAEIQDSTVVCR